MAARLRLGKLAALTAVATTMWAAHGLRRAAAVESQTATPDLFSPRNLTAWCVVPFDAKKRSPEERAAMLQRLGFTRFAYDWRAEHVPTFDAEVEALQRHGIDLVAWWFPTDPKDPTAKTILDVIER